MLDFASLNFLAILLAAMGKFIVGGLWFSKFLFGNLWLEETGLKDKELGDPRNALLIGFGTCLLVSFSFAVLIQMLALELRYLLATTVILAIGITSAQMGLSYAFEGRSIRLFLIYATQCVAEFTVVVLVLSFM